FLTPDDQPRGGAPVLDLMVGLASVNSQGNASGFGTSNTPSFRVMPSNVGISSNVSATPLKPIDSPLIAMLRSAAAKPEDAARIEAHVRVLAEKHPQDFSVRIVAALFAILRSDGFKRYEALQALECVVD